MGDVKPGVLTAIDTKGLVKVVLGVGGVGRGVTKLCVGGWLEPDIGWVWYLSLPHWARIWLLALRNAEAVFWEVQHCTYWSLEIPKGW